MAIRESTLRTWLVRSGVQGRKLHERFFTGLELVHVLWANVKQAEQAVWVWVVCDAKTKTVPVMQLGSRTQEMAYSVVHELKSKLTARLWVNFSVGLPSLPDNSAQCARSIRYSTSACSEWSRLPI